MDIVNTPNINFLYNPIHYFISLAAPTEPLVPVHELETKQTMFHDHTSLGVPTKRQLPANNAQMASFSRMRDVWTVILAMITTITVQTLIMSRNTDTIGTQTTIALITDYTTAPVSLTVTAKANANTKTRHYLMLLNILKI